MTDFADWPLGKRLDFKVTEALMQSSGDDVTDGVRALTILLSEPELVAGLAPEVKREVLRTLLLEHPDAVEDNGRVTIEVPHLFVYRTEVTLTALANWLAPSPAPMEGRSNEF